MNHVFQKRGHPSARRDAWKTEWGYLDVCPAEGRERASAPQVEEEAAAQRALPWGPRGGRFFEGDAFPFSSGSSMKAGILVSTQRGVHVASRGPPLPPPRRRTLMGATASGAHAAPPTGGLRDD